MRLSDRAIWCFVAAGILVSVLASALPTDNARSFVFDACSLIAAGAAVYGILRNDPHRRGVWQLFALGLVLFAAGDVTFDMAIRVFGRADGYPYADVLYLLAYPILAFALVRLARARFDREIAIDSAIVAVALSAVIWQWVITPVLDTSRGATVEHIVAVAYPIMDILLVVVIVHAVFTLPRWTPAAWLLFAGLAVMLVADALYARLVADGTYSDGGALDALWPISYFLLAAAVMHPSMRALWEGDDAGLIRHGRARMLVLGRGALRGAGGRARRRLGIERRGRTRARSPASRRWEWRGASRAWSTSRTTRARCSPRARHGSGLSYNTPPTSSP